MNPEKALNTIASICSKKEYSTQEVREKLKKWEVDEKESARIIEFLQRNKFVDDRRFALSYVRDKFRFNKWGRQKISQMLRQKGVDPAIATEALSSLSEAGYDETCLALLQGKLKSLKEDTPMRTKAKLFRFAASRGFDFDTINRCFPHLNIDPASRWDE